MVDRAFHDRRHSAWNAHLAAITRLRSHFMANGAGRPGRLITVAVTDYGDKAEGFAEALHAKITVFTNWLTDFEHLRFHPTLDGSALRTRHQLELALHELSVADTVLLYLTGHGRRVDDDRGHLLDMPEGQEAWTTVELIRRAFTSGAGHVAVLLDSCHSGAIWKSATDQLLTARSSGEPLAENGLLVVTGFPDDSPRWGEFGDVLDRVLTELRTERQRAPGRYR